MNPENLTTADRELYDLYGGNRNEWSSDALLALANRAEDSELRDYLTSESWDIFRTEEMRYFGP